jgi:hypothetical protein
MLKFARAALLAASLAGTVAVAHAAPPAPVVVPPSVNTIQADWQTDLEFFDCLLENAPDIKTCW